MQDGPTPISTSTAGLPLTQASIQSRTAAQTSAAKRAHANEEISDTLETSDRESDGRQYVQSRLAKANEEGESGGLLDLEG